MICQGAGGGYGDVLDRDPAMVMTDIENQLLSPEVARDIYKVAFNDTNLVLDEEETRALRDKERKARIARSIPYDEFISTWVKDEPAAELPYMGSWGDDASVLVVSPPGDKRYTIPAGSAGVMISNPKDRKINELEAQIVELKTQLESRPAV